MTASQFIVTAVGVALIAVLARFFFRRRYATAAVEHAGVQEVRITVRGGYSPDVIQARTGMPLRITFDRQEDGRLLVAGPVPGVRAQPLPGTVRGDDRRAHPAASGLVWLCVRDEHAPRHAAGRGRRDRRAC